MNPEEMAKAMAQYRVMAEQLRRARRAVEQLQKENAALKKECEALREEQSEAARLFDLENEGFFAIVHQNYSQSQKRCTKVEVYHFE